MELIKHTLWDTLNIKWINTTLNANGKRIDLPESINIPLWDKVKVRTLIGTVYPNIPLSSASLHGHPQSSLGATLGVRMSVTAYGNLSTMSSVWPIGASRLNLRPRPLSI